jgi:hypothetical protein
VEGLALDEAGAIYGTANFGGPIQPVVVGGVVIPQIPNGFHTLGTRFKLTRHGDLKLIPAPAPSAGGPGGASLGLMLDSRGNLVFAAPGGGSVGFGGVFAQNPHSAALTTIHGFTGFAPGPAPLPCQYWVTLADLSPVANLSLHGSAHRRPDRFP